MPGPLTPWATPTLKSNPVKAPAAPGGALPRAGQVRVPAQQARDHRHRVAAPCFLISRDVPRRIAHKPCRHAIRFPGRHGHADLEHSHTFAASRLSRGPRSGSHAVACFVLWNAALATATGSRCPTGSR